MSRLRSTVGPAILAAGIAASCPGASAQTLQMNPEDTTNVLRGRVSEEEINRQLTAQSVNPDGAQDDETQVLPSVAPRPYEPASTGSVAAPAAASIFDDPQAQRQQTEIFGDVPLPAARPTTALERSKARDEQLAATPQSAAERAKRAGTEDSDAQESDAALKTGTVRVGTVDSQVDRRIDPGSEAAAPIEGLQRRPEEDPYAAVGIQAGTFTLRPTLEQGVTVTDNVNYSPDGSDAVLSETTLRLNAISEHGGDRTVLNGYGIYRKSVSGEDYDYTEGGFDAEFERQIGNDYKARATIEYAIRPESFSSPVEIPGAASQPIQQTLTATAGVEKDIGKARLGVTAKVDREWYGDADVEGLGSVSQEDRNSTLATIALRGGYEISPALTPFVEVEAGRRFYDVEVDAGGIERSANHLAARTGVELDFGEKLSGEVSGGYVLEDLDDERLGTIGGLSMAAELNWSPQRGTVVTLTGSTEVEGTTDPDSAGSLLHNGRLSIERQIRANLTASASAGIGYRDYQGSGDNDVILSAEVGGTYWLNRYAGLVARARHETLKSTLEGRDTQTNSIFLGLRLQR